MVENGTGNNLNPGGFTGSGNIGNPWAGTTPGPWASGYVYDNQGNLVPVGSGPGGGGGGGGVPTGSLFDWTKLGVGAFGSYLSGKNQDQMTQLQQLVQLLQTQMSREDSSKSLMANYLSQQQINNNNLAQKQSVAGLDSTQMDPYMQAKDLNAANVRASFANSVGGNPNARMTAPLDMSALSPDSLQKSADQFYSTVANANPNVPVGGMSPSAEQFRQTNNTNNANQQAKMMALIQQYLASIGSPVANMPSLPQVP